jgi:hypothetical protein
MSTLYTLRLELSPKAQPVSLQYRSRGCREKQKIVWKQRQHRPDSADACVHWVVVNAFSAIFRLIRALSAKVSAHKPLTCCPFQPVAAAMRRLLPIPHRSRLNRVLTIARLRKSSWAWPGSYSNVSRIDAKAGMKSALIGIRIALPIR